jgi:uncharacterized membrane protein YfhO
MKQKSNNKIPSQPVEKVLKKVPEKPSGSAGFIEKHSLWITLGLMSFLVLVIFFDYITGAKYYLFKDIGSDSLNGYYPYLINSVRYFKTEGFPAWSFAMGMGQSIYPGGYADPYAFIINLVGLDHLAYGIILSDVAKYFTTCLLFFLYLRVLDVSKTSSVIGALLFSLSGFMLVAGSWYTFSLEVVYMAFMLYAFEKLYKHNNWILFPLAIALIAMYSPFDIYLYGLFLVIYVLFRVFSDTSFRFRDFLILVGKLAGLTLLGLLIGSVFFIPGLQKLIDSPRVTGNASYFQTLMSKPLFSMGAPDHTVTTIMRAFGNDLIGNGSGFTGWYNYLEAPLFYIGLLPLLLFTQVFTFIDRRKKIVYAIFLAVYLVPVIFPFFRYAFWAFTGDYYRGFSLFFSFVLLFFSLQALTELDKAKKVNLIVLLVTFAGLMGFLYYPYEKIDQMIKTDLQSMVMIFLVLYTSVLALFNFVKNRSALKAVLIILVCIELMYFNGKTVRDRVSITSSEWMQKAGYNDYTVDAVAWLHANDKGFYRLNKDYSSGPAMHRSMNDALVQDFYGTPCYSSFNQKYYIRFLEEAGVIEKGVEEKTRWAPGFSTRPVLQIIGSVKYNLSNKENPVFMQMGYDYINKFEDVKLLKNKFFLPLGFTYNKYITLSQFRSLSTMQRDYAILNNFVAEEPVDPAFSGLKKFSISDTIPSLTWDKIAASVSERRSDTLQITSFSNNRIMGKITMKEPGVLFLSIPYDKGWKGKVDNKIKDPFLCNAGFLGFYLDKGDHTVQLDYEVYQMAMSIWLSVAGLLILLALVAVSKRKFLLEKLSTKN